MGTEFATYYKVVEEHSKEIDKWVASYIAC